MEILSIKYFIFVTIVVLINGLLNGNQRKLWLLFSSYLFLLFCNKFFLGVLVISTIFNFFWGYLIKMHLKDKSSKIFLIIGLVVNIFAFSLFKTGGIVIINPLLSLLHDGFTINHLIPLGYSFYTLSSISYLIDVYIGRIKACDNIVDFSLFLSYFPKLLAGPIERAGTFLPQLQKEREITFENKVQGIYLIFIGLVRKVIIAGVLNQVIPKNIFVSSYSFSFIDLLGSPILYGFWLYNDFAGYSNIVRGISNLLGIQLLKNFYYPFFSKNFTEFWNQWHVSLSSFLRDYLFYPLNRFLMKTIHSRKSLLVIIIPPFITMLISGLWHSFTWNMVIWGGLYGVFIIIDRYTRFELTGIKNVFLSHAIIGIKIMVIFILVSMSWIPFSTGDIPSLLNYFSHINSSFGNANPSLLYSGLKAIMVVLCISLSLDFIQYKSMDEFIFIKWPVPIQGLLFSIGLLGMLFIRFLWSSGTNLEFLYQTF